MALGIDRVSVDHELHHAFAAAVAAGIAEPDGHNMYLGDASPETAAVLVLFHQEHPSYWALMYLRFVYNDADRRLRDWIIRKYAAMLVHGPAPVTESGTYGLTIDYFENDADAPDVLAALLTQVPASRWGGILRAAGPLPWPVKRDLFLTAAQMPALHDPLGVGIAASIWVPDTSLPRWPVCKAGRQESSSLISLTPPRERVSRPAPLCLRRKDASSTRSPTSNSRRSPVRGWNASSTAASRSSFNSGTTYGSTSPSVNSSGSVPRSDNSSKTRRAGQAGSGSSPHVTIVPRRTVGAVSTMSSSRSVSLQFHQRRTSSAGTFCQIATSQ